MTKRSYGLYGILTLLSTVAVFSVNANSYEIDTMLISNYYSNVQFNQNGNDFDGMFLRKGETDIPDGHTVNLDGASKTCYKQLQGYYYNNQRGARRRPLDNLTLSAAQALNTSYNELTLSGGFFKECNGVNADKIYGQITHTYKNTDYKLIAGVDYDFGSNSYLSTFSGSLIVSSFSTAFSAQGYIFDTQGGIGELQSDIIFVNGSGSLTTNMNAGDSFTFSGKTTIYLNSQNTVKIPKQTQISVSGNNWDGVIYPPTLAIGNHIANTGEAGIPAAANIYTTYQIGGSGTSLVALSGLFTVNVSISNGSIGQQISIYRSEDGTTRTPNTPDTTCILDSNKTCTFQTDHFSDFSFLEQATKTSTTTKGELIFQITTGNSYCDYGKNISFGAKSVSSTAITFSGNFTTNSGSTTWSCINNEGISTAGSLYIQMSGNLINETNTNTFIQSGNVQISFDSTIFNGSLTGMVRSGSWLPLNIPVTLFGTTTTPDLRIGSMYTDNVQLQVVTNQNQAPGKYSGTLVITLPW